LFLLRSTPELADSLPENTAFIACAETRPAAAFGCGSASTALLHLARNRKSAAKG
jgi:hypothetical protein